MVLHTPLGVVDRHIYTKATTAPSLGMERNAVSSSPKRRRVAVACDFCRKRKIIVCVYQQPQQRVHITQDYLNSLLQRAGELNRADDHRERDSGVNAPEVSTTVQYEEGRLVSVLPSPESPVSAQHSADPETGFPVDGMVCTGPSPPMSAGYFGKSSTFAFLEVLQNISVRGESSGTRYNTPLRILRSEPVCSSSRDTDAPTAPSIRSRFLPPRETADLLLDIYFSRIADLYCVLHEPSFRDEYEKLWHPGPPASSLFLCMLNSVFALSSMFAEDLDEANSEAIARTFSSQAEDLLCFDTLDNAGVPVVQALLLMGQYLQGTTEANRCWYVFGLAIRIAQGLGLHLNHVNNKFPVLEREIRKRCWCGCLVMDVVLAMTFGRPMMISPEHCDVDMPEAVDDKQITTTQIRALGNGERQPPRILLFIHKLKLYLVLQRILQSVYQSSNGADGGLGLGKMMEFDQQLLDWQSELPPHLQMDNVPNSSENSGAYARQRNILYARYLTVRVLLTRPSLGSVARKMDYDRGLQPLGQTFAYSAALACIATAKRLIEHIQTNLVIEGCFLGASWYNTYSVFSAGLVLFGAQMIPGLRSEVAGGRHWDNCISTMRLLSHRCSSARGCLSMLQSFDRRLSQSRDATHDSARINLQQNNIDDTLPDYLHVGIPDFQDWIESWGLDEAFGTQFPVF
ncbi:fungal-specific transcription factor domain-containing protein [Xylariales sp. PMI_506]|nr:fungal-specific transcription factor domain-containing protein [Xylariales sp. PMI_506]